MELKESKTHRGFKIIEFKDLYGDQCNIQKSSLATEDAIWFGIENGNPKILKNGEGWVEFPIPEEVLISTRMHLTRDQVEKLLPILQKFVDTGEI